MPPAAAPQAPACAAARTMVPAQLHTQVHAAPFLQISCTPHAQRKASPAHMRNDMPLCMQLCLTRRAMPPQDRHRAQPPAHQRQDARSVHGLRAVQGRAHQGRQERVHKVSRRALLDGCLCAACMRRNCCLLTVCSLQPACSCMPGSCRATPAAQHTSQHPPHPPCALRPEEGKFGLREWLDRPDLDIPGLEAMNQQEEEAPAMVGAAEQCRGQQHLY